MIVCPVCEHPQPSGADCEVCGKRLVAGLSEEDLAIPAVEGLEPTLHAAAGEAADGGRLPDLEPTPHEPGAAVAEDRTPDLEETRAAPVDVDVAPVPDVERTAAEPADDAPAALPAFPTCRYCRTPAMPGERICGRCGMRLPVAAATEERRDEPALAICSCGAPLRAGASLCPRCGARRA
jgi:hypothetical protein